MRVARKGLLRVVNYEHINGFILAKNHLFVQLKDVNLDSLMQIVIVQIIQKLESFEIQTLPMLAVREIKEAFWKAIQIWWTVTQVVLRRNVNEKPILEQQDFESEN